MELLRYHHGTIMELLRNYQGTIRVLLEGVPKVGRGNSGFIGLLRDFGKWELGVALRASRPIPCQLRREQCLERKIRRRSFQ